MGLAVQARHLKRHAEIAELLWKYGHSDLVRHAGLEELLTERDPNVLDHEDRAPEELAATLERMGPAFVKVGQFLASRPDILPAAYCEALARLQDRCEPIPFPTVQQVIAEELGHAPPEIFRDLDPTPVASASLGQVHRARLADGREVAVKVQRPEILPQLMDDLEAFEGIASLLDAHSRLGRQHDFTGILHRFRASLLRELDYELEARNLAMLRRNLARFPRVLVPEPFPELTTRRVLTMEWVQGRKVTEIDLPGDDTERRAMAEELFRAYLQQTLVDGFFHADPHPGNVLVTDDGRVALIDLGMVARVPPRLQDQLLRLTVAISEGQGEEAADVAIQIGTRLDWFDRERCVERIVELVCWSQGADVGGLRFGRAVLDVGRLAGDHGLRVPHDLLMLGKALLNLDEIGRCLAPSFEPNAAIRRYSADLWSQRAWRSFTPGQFLATAIDLRDFVRVLPARTAKILDALANNELEVRVDAIDEDRLIEGLQAIANRIAMGLVLAALIVGGALLVNVPAPSGFFGASSLGMVLLALAGLGGLWQGIQMLRHHGRSKP